MQWGSENQASGQSVAPILNMLRRYLDPENYTQLNKFFRTRATSDEFIQKLITSKGSPSMLDLIEDEIVSVISGKPNKYSKQYNSSQIQLDTIKIPVDTKQINKQIKKDIMEVSKSISYLKSVNLRNLKGQFTSLTSIQVLLNQQLHDQIKKNMGSPALNYRTGRFAKSAEITGMSISRQGMITAFYTYMKYPYQTFEPGYAQGSIQRNPKTLISTSIRELATNIVGNRLRAVRV